MWLCVFAEKKGHICLFMVLFQGSLVNGGVLIVHQSCDGKHHYEVENVVKYKKESGKKMFVRYTSDPSFHWTQS